MKCYRLDKDNPRIRFSRQENNEKKTAADEPYEFCQDYQSALGCKNPDCQLVHAAHNDALHYQCTGEVNRYLMHALAAITTKDCIHGIFICKQYERNGNCKRDSHCPKLHIDKEYERRKRYPHLYDVYGRRKVLDSPSPPTPLKQIHTFERYNNFNGKDSVHREMYKSAASPSSSTSSSIPKPKFMPMEYNFSALGNDALFDFLFNKHLMDLQRKENFMRIIDILENNRNRLNFLDLDKIFFRKHNQHLDYQFLRELFSSYWVAAGKEVEIFRRLTRVFRVEEPNIIRFIFGEDTSDFESKNIFVSSKPRINEAMHLNVKLADKVFEILPAQRKMEIVEVMKKVMSTREYKEVKEKSPEAPPMNTVRFIGFLQLYWSDVFKIWPEDDQFWIKRHVLHHMKPSQEKKYMKEIIESYPAFPIISDLLTETHLVQVHTTNVPSDGIGLQLLELDYERKFIEKELRKYYTEVMSIKEKEERRLKLLHPNETFNGVCCLRTVKDANDQDEAFRRCRITGQSNGLAMVQDVDHPKQGLQEIKSLYQIPRLLLGIPQTCVYGILEGFHTQTDNNKQVWKENLWKMSKNNSVRCVARFHRPAERIDYSGRSKHAIYMVTIRINEWGTSNPLQILPGGT